MKLEAGDREVCSITDTYSKYITVIVIFGIKILSRVGVRKNNQTKYFS